MTFCFIEAGQIDMLGVFENLGDRLTFGVAEYPVAVVQVAVQFHEPDGDEAIEPSVGQRLHGLLKAVLPETLLQPFPLLGHSKGKWLRRR